VTTLSDLVGAVGSGLVRGRVLADQATAEVSEFYRHEPLLAGARVPRMVLSAVTAEFRFVTALVDGGRVEVLVTAEELAGHPVDRLGTLVLTYTEDDLETAAQLG
jgi:hypothetical protein